MVFPLCCCQHCVKSWIENWLKLDASLFPWRRALINNNLFPITMFPWDQPRVEPSMYGRNGIVGPLPPYTGPPAQVNPMPRYGMNLGEGLAPLRNVPVPHPPTAPQMPPHAFIDLTEDIVETNDHQLASRSDALTRPATLATADSSDTQHLVNAGEQQLVRNERKRSREQERRQHEHELERERKRRRREEREQPRPFVWEPPVPPPGPLPGYVSFGMLGIPAEPPMTSASTSANRAAPATITSQNMHSAFHPPNQ